MSGTTYKKAIGVFPEVQTFRGRAPILRLQPLLASLAEEFGQPGAADAIDFFLTQPYTGGKIPYLFLVTEAGAAPGADTVFGAVLLHQYQVSKLRLPLFVSEDQGGERNVLAPAADRAAVAHRVAEHLLRKRAQLVAISLQQAAFPVVKPLRCPRDTPPRRALWSCSERSLTRYLPLKSTYDGTLAELGKHTRRNLRYYTRLASADFGCSFVPHAEISLPEFLALNPLCAYPTPDHVARWRFESAQSTPGGIFAGLRAADGRWLCLLGGRRSHGTTAVDWQMNLTGLDKYSLSTVMRAALIEHEVSLGSRRLLFEGGTPHSMHLNFPPEEVTDFVAARRSLLFDLLRRHPARLLPEGNFLAEILGRSDLEWQPWV